MFISVWRFLAALGALALLLFGLWAMDSFGASPDWFRRPNVLSKDVQLSAKDFLISGDAVIQNVLYGMHARQKMDIYLPPQPRNAPIMMMVHGGGWTTGDKALDSVVGHKARYFLGKGYIYVSVNYRFAPEVTPLEQRQDIARAMLYVQKNAASWGGDPYRIVLFGHSAGGHLVTLLTADHGKADVEDLEPWRGTVVLDSAAMDVEGMMAGGRLQGYYYQAFGEDRNLWRESSPLHLLTKTSIPMLVVCSTYPGEYTCNQVESFAEKAKGLRTPVEVLPWSLSHGDLTINLGLSTEYTQRVGAFVERVLD